MTGPIRRPTRLAAFVLLAAAVPLEGCGERRSPEPRPAAAPPAAADVAILAGRASGIAAIVAPLSCDARAAEWQQRRLASLIDDGRERTFFLLRVANLDDAAAARLVGLGLSLRTSDGERAAEDLRDVVGRERVRTSSLAYRALCTFEGQVLAGGASFDAIVAFPGEVSLVALDGGRLTLEGREVPLAGERLDVDALRALLDLPRRDAILARVPGEVGAAAPEPAAAPDAEAGR